MFTIKNKDIEDVSMFLEEIKDKFREVDKRLKELEEKNEDKN